MITPKKQAAGVQAETAFNTNLNRSNFKPFSTKNQRGIPRNWLPSPFYYYKKIFPNITNGSEWASVCCCFHKDANPSLSLNLKSGGFFCHACGAKGGDLIVFHRLHKNTGFSEAVEQLKAIKRGEDNGS